MMLGMIVFWGAIIALVICPGTGGRPAAAHPPASAPA
jgi:hypothetical protein